MNRPPVWFTAVVAVALAWNIIGLLAVVSDLLVSAPEITAPAAQQQAIPAARPLWSVAASVVAVVGGTLGCLALLLRRRESLVLLAASLVGVVLQDIGIFVVAGVGPGVGPVPFILQSLVLAIAVGLVFLARHATRRGWL
ncbi:MAG: hypothetical protein ACOYK7_09125 [Pirellulales bacterium]|jgi:hypothetical protein